MGMESILGAIDTRPIGRSRVLPVLFVVDHDAKALDVLLDDLSRRFGNDFAVEGSTSPDAALTALHELATTEQPVALLLADAAAEGFLARAHELHPRAKRVLLVDRNYSSRSPAVQAMTLGRVDYHIVRPWANEETMYHAMSEYFSSWTSEHEPRFEEFRIVAAANDSRALTLRDVMTDSACRSSSMRSTATTDGACCTRSGTTQ
jgi:thioredoxin reductase (NADPH)